MFQTLLTQCNALFSVEGLMFRFNSTYFPELRTNLTVRTTDNFANRILHRKKDQTVIQTYKIFIGGLNKK